MPNWMVHFVGVNDRNRIVSREAPSARHTAPGSRPSIRLRRNMIARTTNMDTANRSTGMRRARAPSVVFTARK